MYLEEIENEYNITLSDPEKQYMLANEYTLVVHKDGYTLIKDKIKESCSAFKYVGVHSTGVNKTVDLNDHYLVREDLLGNVYEEDIAKKLNILYTTVKPTVADPSSGIIFTVFGIDNNSFTWNTNTSCNNDVEYYKSPLCPPTEIRGSEGINVKEQIGKIASFSYVRKDLVDIHDEWTIINLTGFTEDGVGFGNYALIYDNTRTDLSSQIFCASVTDADSDSRHIDASLGIACGKCDSDDCGPDVFSSTDLSFLTTYKAWLRVKRHNPSVGVATNRFYNELIIKSWNYFQTGPSGNGGNLKCPQECGIQYGWSDVLPYSNANKQPILSYVVKTDSSTITSTDLSNIISLQKILPEGWKTKIVGMSAHQDDKQSPFFNLGLSPPPLPKYCTIPNTPCTAAPLLSCTDIADCIKSGMCAKVEECECISCS